MRGVSYKMIRPMRQSPLGAIVVVCLLFLTTNVIALDMFLLRQKPTVTVREITNTKQPTSNESCSTACLSEIRLATASSKTVTSSQGIYQPLQTQSVKEFFVPFGSGSNNTDEWTDVLGLSSYIDSTSYTSLKQAVFEAAVHIPTGNEIVYVRLFNTTDKHPVWFSEVSHEGGGAKLLVSKPITLDLGNKQYQVQMKTSLKFTALLDQARVHITTF